MSLCMFNWIPVCICRLPIFLYGKVMKMYAQAMESIEITATFQGRSGVLKSATVIATACNGDVGVNR